MSSTNLLAPTLPPRDYLQRAVTRSIGGSSSSSSSSSKRGPGALLRVILWLSSNRLAFTVLAVAVQSITATALLALYHWWVQRRLQRRLLELCAHREFLDSLVRKRLSQTVLLLKRDGDDADLATSAGAGTSEALDSFKRQADAMGRLASRLDRVADRLEAVVDPDAAADDALANASAPVDIITNPAQHSVSNVQRSPFVAPGSLNMARRAVENMVQSSSSGGGNGGSGGGVFAADRKSTSAALGYKLSEAYEHVRSEIRSLRAAVLAMRTSLYK